MSKRKARIEIYRAKDGWRWRVRSSNAAIVAVSGESFVSIRNARKSFERAWFVAVGVDVEVVQQ